MTEFRPFRVEIGASYDAATSPARPSAWTEGAFCTPD